ncbi:universal stress protein [Chitinophaga qingshengii]|uniref:Universal stress protein n=1 Tax=Chitinophaga qingshengii TaxID=1569794 RepID=A0ABR7TZT7_9BACT|nr:universal stress protein [Chitinophaga qingshengii]MBC9934989.1 universal stress protein [Chitinophaga qingshengii]
MKSMLILTDFSDAAFRAAEYATHLAPLLGAERLILYHAYRTMVVGSDVPVPAPQVENLLYIENMEKLAALQDQLRMMTDTDTKYELLAEDAFLPDQLNKLCRENEVELVVMGVAGKTGLQQFFMGSNTAQVLKTSEFPVLVVPLEAVVGKEITSIVFSTDLENISKASLEKLHHYLDLFKPEVHVINVESATEDRYSEESRKQITRLHELLEKYNPAFHYVTGTHIADSVIAFSKEHHASLIVTVPKKHSFLSSIFHKSISKELAYNSNVPLLSIPALPD